MKFYIIPRKHVDKVPGELYKGKIVVITWLKNSEFVAHYALSYDYTTFALQPTGKTFILYNLTGEDFTHLNLLGLPIRSEYADEYPCLEDAINAGLDSFQEEITI